MYSLRFLLVSIIVVHSTAALSYYSTLDNGETLKESIYRVGLGPQFILNQYDGAQFAGNVDMGLNEAQSVRGVLGFGKVDFELGAVFKWIPFPDIKSQPAFGGTVGLHYGKIGQVAETSFRVTPLMSKKFMTEIGDVVPYIGLPISLRFRSGSADDGTSVPVQFTGGAEISFLNLPNWSFFGEVGLNVTKAFSYIALNANYQFSYRK